MEEGSVFLIIGGFEANPRLIRVGPFEPKPTETQRPGELVEVEDPQAAEIFGAANTCPVNLAFSPVDSRITVPKHVSSNLVEGF